jgi:hypothetical protein
MFNRFVCVLGLVSALVAGMLLTPKPAAAQQGQDYFTYVSEWAVPRAQWAAFEKEQDSGNALMQKMVADGTIVAWGNDEVRVHQEDGWTHENWMTATSRANLLKALEAEWTMATDTSYTTVTKHIDLFLHTIAHGGKTASNAKGYIRVAFYQAKPGQEEAVEGLLMKEIKPMFDAAINDGTLLMYNIDAEEIHTDAPGGYDLAMLFPDGAAMDKFYSNLMMAMQKDPAFFQVFDSVTISKDHRDTLGRVTTYQHQ